MQGRLDTISVAELCAQLGGQRMTGTVVLTREDGAGQVSFRDGEIVHARSPATPARIGDRLVHAGLLDPYYVDQAAQAQHDAPPGTGIAAVLVDRGLISEDAARVFLQEQMIDAITDLLGWRDGSFEVTPDTDQVVRLAVSVPTEVLLTEVRRRLAEQELVREVVHSRELVPVRTTDSLGDLALDETAVLTAVDGSRTVGDLAEHLGFGENEIRRVVYGLTLLDAVDLSGQARPADGTAMDEVEVAVADDLDEALTKLTEQQSEPVAVGEFATAAAADLPATPTMTEPPPATEPSSASSQTVDDEPDSGATSPAAPASAAGGIFEGRSASDDIDEPTPWVGYAQAKTRPPEPVADKTEVTPPAAAPDEVAFFASPSASESASAEPTEPEPRRGAPQNPQTRSEAANWLAQVSGGSDEADTDAPQPSSDDEPAAPDEPDEQDVQPAAPAAYEPPPDGEPAPPASAPPGGDDLSALLAELSSLSTDDDQGDGEPAPPPRKPPSSAPSDDKQDRDKKRRLFGR